MAATFPAVTPASVVTAGGGTAPTDPATTAPSAVVTGALGLTARQLLPRSPNPDIYGGEMSFTMTVDPVKQNFFTVKFWGSDTSSQWLVLNCNGKEVGWRHVGTDQGIFYSFNTYSPGWFPNRFIYRTTVLPLNLTQGVTSVTIKIRSLGWLAYYDGTGLYFGHYQNLMNAASPNLYSAYTHGSGFFDYAGEIQGTAPTVLTPRTTPTQATEMSKWQTQLNNTVASLLAASPSSLTADNVDFLAQSYGVTTSTAYHSSAALNQVIAAIDAMVAAYSAAPTSYMGSFGNSSWGGYLGPVGDAIRLLWPQLGSGSTMSATVAYGGVLGTVSRSQAWSTALRASIDYGRYNRRGITNQEMYCATNIYEANRGLELVDPANALNESEALRYPYEACGISPWVGDDQPTGGTDGMGGGPIATRGTAPNGPNWYMVTSKGTTKENDFVGSDYGELGCNFYNLGILANDASLKAQGLKMLRARAYFRNPGIDSNGYLAMYGTDAIGARNDQEINRPTHVAYLGRALGEIQTASLGASVIGSDLMGYIQQHINEGQFYVELALQNANFADAPYLPGYIPSIVAQAQTGIKLPETSGQPDFAWGDEENMVVAAKHGSGTAEERFYANLNWRAGAIDGIAKVFRQTVTTTNIAEVTCDDVQFQPSGQTLLGSSSVDAVFPPPDNPVNAYSGVPWLVALRSDLTTVPLANQDGGRAWGYTLRYGNWLVGINGHHSENYNVKLPGGFTSATDLVSGKTLTAPIILSPKTTVVLYLGTTTDSSLTPGAPTYLTVSGTSSQMVLNWNATTGATSYIVQRATSSSGPFTTIASGIAATTYTDTSVIAGAAYYYQVIAVNAAGQSHPSPIILSEAGMPSPWANLDIGTVALPGSSLYQNGLFTVAGSGSDIGGTSDSFQFAYVPLTGDGTITARATSITGASSSSKIGVMMRETLTSSSKHAVLLVENGGDTLILASRKSTSGGTTFQAPSNSATPLWLRLTRVGKVFTAYQSPDGVNWTQVGSPVTITMNSAINVGLVGCSRNSTEPNLVYSTAGLGLVYTTLDHVSAPSWTPPDAPASLSTVASQDNVTLTWSASTRATNYNIKRSTSSGGPYTTIATVASTTTYTDLSVPATSAGTSYYYVVSALNAQGESLDSSESALSVLPVPAVPTGLAVNAGTGQVTLNWAISASATSYTISRSTTSGGSYTTVATVAGTSYTDTIVTPGTTYYYVVQAVNAQSTSANSVEVELVTGTSAITGFTPYSGMIVLNSGGILNISETSGTYASSVVRATGLYITGGQAFTTGGTANEPANFLITGSGSGNTRDFFGPLSLVSGAFYGKFYPNSAYNQFVAFDSLTRNPGTQLNFGHAPNFGGIGVGANTIASATANSVNVVFTTAPTNLMVGSGGAAGTPTVNILPFAFVNTTLATYDATYGLRPLNTTTELATLSSGMTAGRNTKVAANTTLNANTSVNAIWGTSGTISGSGALTVTSGAISCNASFTIANATLAFGSAEGLINVGNARTLTINSVITGTGGLTMGLEDYNNTTANLILGGANTFTGVTTIEGNSAAMKVVLTNGLALQGSTLDYNNYGASLQFGSGSSNLTSAAFGGLKGAQNLALTNSGTGGGAVTLTVGSNGDSTTYTGVLSGAGALIKAGTGTLTLTGVNTYTGATTINGGALWINGSTASGSTVGVNLGGTLGGTGTVNGATTVANGGILAPGNTSAGTLTFSGGLKLNGGAVLELGLGTSSDKVVLSAGNYTAPTSGTVTINVTSLAGFSVGTYKLVTGATGISAGSFAMGNVPTGYSYALSSASGTLSLTVAPQAPVGLTATTGDGQVTLAWTASANATNYQVKRAIMSGGPYTTLASPTGTSFTDAGLTNLMTYYYVASAINNSIASANSAEVSAAPSSPFQQWLMAKGLSATIADASTPDGDGVPILLKYATAMTPGTPSAAGPANLSNPANHLILQFNRLSPAPVNYLVEASSDLVNWTSIASLASGATGWTGTAAVSESGTDPVAVTVTDGVDIDSSTPRFLRLRVTTATNTTVPGTVPAGISPLTLAASATTATSLTLDNTPVARNAIQAVTSGTLTVVSAGAWGNVAAPYALRLLTGNASGVTFPIIAVNGNALTLATQGVNLTQLVAVGDTYEILPANTLASLFGATGGSFKTGASATAADVIYLWNGSAWLPYYNNGTSWKQTGTLVSQNNTLLPPGAGWLIARNGTTPLTLYGLGRVPEVALRQFTAPAATSYLAGPYPVSTKLASTGFASASNWLNGTSAATADVVYLWSGTVWAPYFYNGTHWRQTGSLVSQDAVVLKPGQPAYVSRRSLPTPVNAFIVQPLPYTP